MRGARGGEDGSACWAAARAPGMPMMRIANKVRVRRSCFNLLSFSVWFLLKHVCFALWSGVAVIIEITRWGVNLGWCW